MDSLKMADDAAAAVQVTPNRVTLEHIESQIVAEYIMTGDEITSNFPCGHDSMNILTVCILVLKNGFTIIGKSAPADAENFNAELGRKFAREDAVRQIWPLEGYALRKQLSE